METCKKDKGTWTLDGLRSAEFVKQGIYIGSSPDLRNRVVLLLRSAHNMKLTVEDLIEVFDV